MKCIYYTYWLSKNNQRYFSDIKHILNHFTALKNEQFRKSFSTDHGDNLLLYHLSGDVFLFVVTKDKEFIKAISENTLDQSSIITKLAIGEHVGFSSYICMGNHGYSMAGTFHGPKHGRWDAFVNDLLEKIGCKGVSFYSKPVPTLLTPADAVRFSVKSSVKIQLRKGHFITRQLSEIFGNDPEVGGVDVVIKPSRGSSLNQVWNHLPDYVDDPAVKKVVVRGSENIEDAISEFFIVGSGNAYDTLDNTNENHIVSDLQRLTNRNPWLKAAINELKTDTTYSKDHIPSVDDLHDIRNWPAHIIRP